MSGDDNGGWTQPSGQSYTARDMDGNSLGQYPSQQEADAAVEEHYKNLREQYLDSEDNDPPPPPPGKKTTELGIFGKIFTFLGCVVALIVGIFVIAGIIGWAIATFH